MRVLHIMIRITDLERSIRFYTEILKMKLLRKNDFPEGKFTLAFLGYGEESQTTALELTHNWETSQYDLGNAYGHLAIGVDDVYQACEDIKKSGGKVTREPGPMKHGSTVLAFVEDPDGYKIELLQDEKTKTN
ncbi:MAG: lactoylglutathione lyase [Candidatus Aceula meridiana]|nr:lactoylglutathione lyase [Candidatus Aceula meridiana]